MIIVTQIKKIFYLCFIFISNLVVFSQHYEIFFNKTSRKTELYTIIIEESKRIDDMKKRGQSKTYSVTSYFCLIYTFSMYFRYIDDALLIYPHKITWSCR